MRKKIILISSCLSFYFECGWSLLGGGWGFGKVRLGSPGTEHTPSQALDKEEEGLLEPSTDFQV